jgi:hypothetical protein
MSLPFNLSSTDRSKILTGAGIAALGIFGGVAIDQLTLWATQQDLGTTAGIVAAGVCSVVANLLRKWMTQTGGGQ